MGSTDYLNSARRAAIVMGVIALAVLGAAGHRLAVTFWGAAPVALGPSGKPESESHKHASAVCGAKSSLACANGRIAFWVVDDGSTR